MEFWEPFIYGGLGAIINELIRHWRDSRGWWVCPISTCDFRFRLGGWQDMDGDLAKTLKRDHVLGHHNEKEKL